MIKIKRNCKENEGRSQGTKRSSEPRNFSGLRNFAAQNRPLRKWPSAAKWFRSPKVPAAKLRVGYENSPPLRNNFAAQHTPLRKFSQLRNPLLAHECHFAAQELHFPATKWLRNPQSVKSPIFAAIAQFRRVFRSCETPLWHTSAISQHSNPISQLRNGLRNVLRKGPSSMKMPFCCEISHPLRKLKWPLVSNF